MDQVTADIKQAIDIVSLLGEYGLRLEPAGAKYKCVCPFHDDHRPSMMVDPKFQNYRCWACGAKGDIFSFVQAQERISFVEAKERLAEKAGITLRKSGASGSDRMQQLFRTLAWAREQFQICLFEERTGSEARAYLQQRGLTVDTARRFGLGFAPANYEWLQFRAKTAKIADENLIGAGLIKEGTRGGWLDVFRGRLMFPITDERKRVLGFGGRILATADTDAPKYINTPATDVYHKSRVLYGLDIAVDSLRAAAKSEEKSIVVMEGYTDCLMAYQAGFERAVATCGTALTVEHLRKLKNYSDRVVLMFDGDAAGQKAAKLATTLCLSEEIDLRLCVLPESLDPCDYVRREGADALRAVVATANDALDFQLTTVRGGGALQTLEGRRQALDQVLAVLAEVPPAPRQSLAVKYELALSRVASTFEIDELKLRKRITELREQRDGRPPSAAAAPAALTELMDRRERQIVQFLVSNPAVGGQLEPLFPVDAVKHSDLRRLTQTCYDLYDELGDGATVDSLRERLDDPVLDAYVIELCDGAPAGERFEQGLADIKRILQRDRRRAELAVLGRHLTDNANPEAHKQFLRDSYRNDNS